MQTFFLVLHLMVAVTMIGIILLQRSEGGGMGFGSSTLGGAMTSRGTANFLTRLTAILAAIFMGISLLLSILASQQVQQKILAPVIQSGKVEAPQRSGEGLNSDKAPQIPVKQEKKKEQPSPTPATKKPS
ncbi:MAG: preprotein translocase subunit SecG [Alphaproteobacteria bacterium]